MHGAIAPRVEPRWHVRIDHELGQDTISADMIGFRVRFHLGPLLISRLELVSASSTRGTLIKTAQTLSHPPRDQLIAIAIESIDQIGEHVSALTIDSDETSANQTTHVATRETLTP